MADDETLESVFGADFNKIGEDTFSMYYTRKKEDGEGVDLYYGMVDEERKININMDLATAGQRGEFKRILGALSPDMTEEVINAIATLLAADLTPRITGGEWGWKRRQELLDEFENLVLPNAMGINRSQQFHDERPRLSKYSWLGGRNWDEDYE